ncbi:hypothetical protein IWW51_002732 [Coemansia sp. RSA 2702]|nr:hypothetical protein IWW51_002732 [Coemansia sp. RSA 2702]
MATGLMPFLPYPVSASEVSASASRKLKCLRATAPPSSERTKSVIAPVLTVSTYCTRTQ